MGNYETWAILLFSVAQCAYASAAVSEKGFQPLRSMGCKPTNQQEIDDREEREESEPESEARIDNQKRQSSAIN